MIKKNNLKKKRENKNSKNSKREVDIFICGSSIEYSIFTKDLTRIIYIIYILNF